MDHLWRDTGGKCLDQDDGTVDYVQSGVIGLQNMVSERRHVSSVSSFDIVVNVFFKPVLSHEVELVLISSGNLPEVVVVAFIDKTLAWSACLIVMNICKKILTIYWRWKMMSSRYFMSKKSSEILPICNT